MASKIIDESRDRIRSAHVILIEMCDDEDTDPGNIPRFQVLHDLRSVLFLAAVDDQRLSCVDQHDRVRLSHLEKCGCQRLRVRSAREKLPGAVRSRPRRAAGQSPCQEQTAAAIRRSLLQSYFLFRIPAPPFMAVGCLQVSFPALSLL